MAKAFKLALILDVSPGLSTNFEEFEEIFDCMRHVDLRSVDCRWHYALVQSQVQNRANYEYGYVRAQAMGLAFLIPGFPP